MSELLHDPLTGLPTPFYFYESAKRVRSWANRKGQPLSLISIQPPEIADDPFAKFARSLIDELRGGDLICRMGERNLVLLLLGDLAAAGHLIFRLENRIKPKSKYEATELAMGESLVAALDRLGI